MSTAPFSPKPAGASPVMALMALNCLPAVNRILGGVVVSPGQYATPRAVVLPVGSLYSQTIFPVSASSARTRPPAGRYITPLMTIGVASGFTVGTGAAPRPREPLPPPAGVPRPAGALLNR